MSSVPFIHAFQFRKRLWTMASRLDDVATKILPCLVSTATARIPARLRYQSQTCRGNTCLGEQTLCLPLMLQQLAALRDNQTADCSRRLQQCSDAQCADGRRAASPTGLLDRKKLRASGESPEVDTVRGGR